jgi:capsular polysaccharide biosynthesis protein
MNSRNIRVADLIETIRIDRGRLASQEKLLERLEASIGGLQNQEDLLEYIKGGGEGLLSQDSLRMLVSVYRESLGRQENLLRELSSPIVSEWYPPDSIGAEHRSLPALKLKPIEQATASVDLLVHLKRTLVGRLYVRYLKRIPIVRSLTIRLWRTFYPLYVSMVSRHLGSRASRRWRPLIKMTDHVKTLHLPTAKVFDATRVDTPAPNVFPAEDQAFLVSPHDHYVFPPVYVAEIGEALIYGGTNLVFSQDAVICHDLYDFERDYTSEELHGRHVIDAKKMRMRLLRQDPTPERIAVAAAFVDACSANYAHWLTEVLPRIAVFCSIDQYASIPIIVDGGLHQNIMESLALVVGNEREIITLPEGRAISVGVLYQTSVTGYVPFDIRDEGRTGLSHGLFCPSAFVVLRNCVLPHARRIAQRDLPKKVYIKRTSNYRRVVNELPLHKFLYDQGYVAVVPEKLSFLQQVALFEFSDRIVSETGASVVNMIFGGRDSRICIFISKHKKMAYWYWVNILSSTGILTDYVLGDIVGDHTKGVHSDYEINLRDLLKMEDFFQEVPRDDLKNASLDVPSR